MSNNHPSVSGRFETELELDGDHLYQASFQQLVPLDAISKVPVIKIGMSCIIRLGRPHEDISECPWWQLY